MFPVTAARRAYVDPSEGSDETGDGTAARPWKSLARAGRALSPNQGFSPHNESGDV